MSYSKKTVFTLNLGFLNTVGIVFLILKLLSIEPVSKWSWIWVLSPFWIGFALFGILILIWVVALGLIAYFGLK